MTTFSSIDWANIGAPLALNILSAAVVLIIGHWIAAALSRVLGRVLDKTHVDPAIVQFSSRLSYYTLLVLVVIAALTELGIDTTSLAAAVGAAGLAIGFALKDTLANVAAGIMLVVLRPFKIGERIEAGGEVGIVKEISVFRTVLTRPDNCELTVPNSDILSGSITNFTRNPTRRIDLVVGIAYSDNIEQAKQVIAATLEAHELVLAEPAPLVAVAELGDSSVNITYRPWCRTRDYRNVRFDVIEQVKVNLEKAGITIPFPQRDVHQLTNS